MVGDVFGTGWHRQERRFAATSPRRAAHTVAGLLRRRVIPASWDRLLHCLGALAVACVLAFVLAPSIADLAVFVAVMFFTSSPASTFLPSASEPILMAFGKIHPPLLLAVLAMPGITLAEWVNYRVFGVILDAPKLSSIREARWMRRATAWFAVQPFWTVVICAFTPIPFWMVRSCAVVARYPLGRFTLATALGRFPRVWLVALVGTALPFTARQLAVTALLLVIFLALVAVRRHRPHVVARGYLGEQAFDPPSGARRP